MSADTLATQRPVLLDRQSLTVDGFRELQLQNRPVLLDADCARTAEWGACREWRVEGGGCGVNFDALRALADRLNDPCVPVEFEDGSESGVRAGYGARRRGEMHLRAYVDAWERLAQSGSGAGADRDSGALPYLKDWHVRRDHGQHVADALYQLPPHFADDWLDERSWRGHRGDDYHFVYAGPANSSTPIHHDVLCTYSWSANVVGRKRWLLFAPGDEALLADGRGGLVPDASPQQHARYPADVAARLARAYGRAIQVEQGPGEVLFVPAGWYHQVLNVSDCVSINHNWTDGIGIAHVWRFLAAQASAVRAALSDVAPASGSELAFGSADEWHAHCELILRVDTGMTRADALGMALAGVRRARARAGGLARALAGGALAGVAAVVRGEGGSGCAATLCASASERAGAEDADLALALPADAAQAMRELALLFSAGIP